MTHGRRPQVVQRTDSKSHVIALTCTVSSSTKSNKQKLEGPDLTDGSDQKEKNNIHNNQ